jgi:hypothetical protein
MDETGVASQAQGTTALPDPRIAYYYGSAWRAVHRQPALTTTNQRLCNWEQRRSATEAGCGNHEDEEGRERRINNDREAVLCVRRDNMVW